MPLLLFLIYSFSLSVLVSGVGITMQLTNAELLVHDEDQGPSSRELIHRFPAPILLWWARSTTRAKGCRWIRETMVVDVPRDSRSPRERGANGGSTAGRYYQCATGLSAAAYTVRIAVPFGTETLWPLQVCRNEDEHALVSSAHRVWFNPTQDERWFQSISHLLRMITLFAVLFAGRRVGA